MSITTSKPVPAWTTWVVVLHLLLLVGFAFFAYASASDPSTITRYSHAGFLPPLGLGWLLTWSLGNVALRPRPWRDIIAAWALMVLAAVVIYVVVPSVPAIAEQYENPYRRTSWTISGIGEHFSMRPYREDPRINALLEGGRVAVLVMVVASGCLARLAWMRRHDHWAEIDPVVAAILSRRPGGPGGS